MNIISEYFDNSFELKSKVINTLLIENRELFISFIKQLHIEMSTEEGKIILQDDLKELGFKKYAELIIDPFTLDPNNAKNLKKLYEKIIDNSSNEEIYEKRLVFENVLKDYIEEIVFSSDYELIYDGLDYQNIFKAVNLHIDTEVNNLTSMIIDYMRISSDLSGTKLFIFVNLDNFLTDADLIELQNFICYNNITVFCLQNQLKRKLIENEILRIIDEDLCEI
ncbi:type II-A CRISPR-associated protein Csn2 [uncultured Fenollaria sp.]|uniref:type II-A CRISPR-associated protein Csn2 n=1 Tax=uncultured Fenollaria sp. TaxID=1686315 RepID=UPI0025D2CAF7|nr:type II-A CRISPR-associated protein Csn2 [uncultured Fenollaria sp.]